MDHERFMLLLIEEIAQRFEPRGQVAVRAYLLRTTMGYTWERIAHQLGIVHKKNALEKAKLGKVLIARARAGGGTLTKLTQEKLLTTED